MVLRIGTTFLPVIPRLQDEQRQNAQLYIRVRHSKFVKPQEKQNDYLSTIFLASLTTENPTQDTTG